MKFTDRASPMDKHMRPMVELRGFASGAARRRRCSATPGASTWSATAPPKEQFAPIAEKNHRHSANNPYAQFQDEYTLEEILASPMVYEPLTKLQCCPTSDGARRRGPGQRGLRPPHGLEARPSRSRAWR